MQWMDCIFRKKLGRGTYFKRQQPENILILHTNHTVTNSHSCPDNKTRSQYKIVIDIIKMLTQYSINMYFGLYTSVG